MSGLVEMARYRVNNPSAWDHYDEGASEVIRELADALLAAEREREDMDARYERMLTNASNNFEAAEARALAAEQRASVLEDLPSNDWLLEQARSLSSAKDEDSVRALAWNLAVAFRRAREALSPSPRMGGGEGSSVTRECADGALPVLTATPCQSEGGAA